MRRILTRALNATVLTVGVLASIATPPAVNPTVEDSAEETFTLPPAGLVERTFSCSYRATGAERRSCSAGISWSDAGDVDDSEQPAHRVELELTPEKSTPPPPELLSERRPSAGVQVAVASECDDQEDETVRVCKGGDTILVRVRRVDDTADDMSIVLRVTAVASYPVDGEPHADDFAKVTLDDETSE